MTELVLRPRDAEISAKGHQSKRLPNLDRHLKAERAIRELGSLVSRTPALPQPEINTSMSRRWGQLLLDGHRDSISEGLERTPSAEMIAKYCSTVRAALTTGPDRNVTLAAIALLLESKARAPSNPQVYIEAAVFDIVDLGVSPAAVVGACQRLRREMTFIPEISEVIAACRAETDRLSQALDRGEEAMRRRRALEQQRSDIPALVAFVDKLPEEAAQSAVAALPWKAAGR